MHQFNRGDERAFKKLFDGFFGASCAFVKHYIPEHEAVEDVVADIIEAIKTVLEETPPELVGDIYENGVLMAGGGAMLGGLRKLVERTLQVKCVVAKDAIHCVAKGTAVAFRKMDTLLDGFENIAV